VYINVSYITNYTLDRKDTQYVGNNICDTVYIYYATMDITKLQVEKPLMHTRKKRKFFIS